MTSAEACDANGVHQSDDGDADWDNDEDLIELEPAFDSECKCLFCDETFSNAEDTFAHCKASHGFDINDLIKRYSLDFFGYVKFINFIRSMKLASSAVVNIPIEGTLPWNDDLYLKPVIQDDPLLSYDFPSSGNAEEEVDALKDKLEQAVTALAQMRATVSRLLDDEQDSGSQSSNEDENSSDNDERPSTSSGGAISVPAVSGAGSGRGFYGRRTHNRKLTEDASYFESYDHYSIHQDMLQDRSRTEAYRDALVLNADQVCKNKIVLDVGCGTGILSMFAARAGASKVIGIDQSEIIYTAMDIIRENGFENTIELKKGRVEALLNDLPKVDTIVSEWMGYFLLYEGMMDAVLDARDALLKPGGNMLPNRCSLVLVASEDIENHSKYMGYWSDVYGFKMSAVRREVIKEAHNMIVDQNKLVTNHCTIREWDLMTCRSEECDFESNFVLEAVRDAKVTSIVGYFDCNFNLDTPVTLSTSPLAPPTHWKQMVFWLEVPITLAAGSKLDGVVKVKRNPKFRRSLDVTIVLNGKTMEYQLT